MWITPVPALLAAVNTAKKRREAIKVLYEKRVKVPASSYYADDFGVVPAGENFVVVPLKLHTPPSQTIHSFVEVYPTQDKAKPFVVRDGIVLRAVAFQEQNEGEWDGCWQELTLSKQALFMIERAEQELKGQ